MTGRKTLRPLKSEVPHQGSNRIYSPKKKVYKQFKRHYGQVSMTDQERQWLVRDS